MRKVIGFPSATARNDAEIERALRQALSNHGFSSPAIEAAVLTAMPLFKEFKSVIGRGRKLGLTSTMNDDQLEHLEAELSSMLQKYQIEISDFIQRLIVKVAILEANIIDA